MCECEAVPLHFLLENFWLWAFDDVDANLKDDK